MKSALQTFNDQNSTEFVITTNNKKSLLIKCNHGISRPSKSTGQRPRQHCNFLGCTASINCNKPRTNNVLRVTKVDLKHVNHEISKEKQEFSKATLTAEEENLVCNLKSANAQTSQIKRVLNERFQKKFTIQRLRNLINKLNVPNSAGSSEVERLETYLQQVDEEGGTIEWETDSSGEIKSLFIASKTMLDAFRSTDPPLIQVDTSFNVDKARYKIAAFCYLNPTTNKTEIAAIAYISDESSSSLDFVFRHFSNICCGNVEKIFIVDKDFTQLNSINVHFPDCLILLCQFHTLKFIHHLVSTAVEKIERKMKYIFNLSR